jgi:hypothetical protein
MFDGFVDALSGCDIVSPTITLFKNLRNGSSVRYFVPYDCGWSAVQVKNMLESKGVTVWDLDVLGGDITFLVRESQARYAAYWLDRHRLPNENTMSAEPSGDGVPESSSKGSRNGPKKRQGMLDGVLDGIDGLVSKL